MPRKKIITIIFLILTAINIIIFIFRDHFQYYPYASYASLYGHCDENCVTKWRQYRNDYPVSELQEAKHISDSIIGSQNSNTLRKILKLGGFVHERFKDQQGKPPTELLNASPLNQYKMLCSNDTMQLWCGNFAGIFSFFCWSQGIVTRNIEIMNPGDHHVINECYLPEFQKWVMVDPTSRLLLLSDEQNIFLNLQSFRNALENHTPLTSWKLTGDSVIRDNTDFITPHLQAYYRKQNLCFYYHRIDNGKAYSASNKIKQYLLPVSWYDIYDDKGGNNLAFYIKEIFFFLWLLTFFVFIRSRTKFRT